MWSSVAMGPTIVKFIPPVLLGSCLGPQSASLGTFFTKTLGWNSSAATSSLGCCENLKSLSGYIYWLSGHSDCDHSGPATFTFAIHSYPCHSHSYPCHSHSYPVPPLLLHSHRPPLLLILLTLIPFVHFHSLQLLICFSFLLLLFFHANPIYSYFCHFSVTLPITLTSVPHCLSRHSHASHSLSLLPLALILVTLTPTRSLSMHFHPCSYHSSLLHSCQSFSLEHITLTADADSSFPTSLPLFLLHTTTPATHSHFTSKINKMWLAYW